MTRALASALARNRHLRGGRMLYREDGTPGPADGPLMDGRCAEAGGLKVTGALHILRHTFCSHLSIRGVPPLSIKELAGHRSLRSTMRYMHLWKGEKHRAIQMLEEGGGSFRRGDILETSRSLKTPRPETAELPAASGRD